MSLQRRHLLVAATAWPLGVQAHHGWSSFDADRPIYLEGTVNLAVRFNRSNSCSQDF